LLASFFSYNLFTGAVSEWGAVPFELKGGDSPVRNRDSPLI